MKLQQLRDVAEESLAGRMAVLAACAIANAGLIMSAGVPVTSSVCLATMGVGHYVSWRGRHRKRSTAGQALFGVLLLGALVYLVADLFGGVFGGALPQAKFALIAQAITSFDLKSRRNLFTHVWHSLAILYIGSLFAYTITFLPVVAAWGCAVWLFMHWTRAPVEHAGDRPSSSGPRFGSRNAVWLLAWAVIGGVVFVGMPRFSGRPLAVPLMVSVPAANTGAEALPAVLPLLGSAPAPGDTGINLRARGHFGDEVVMHVRATGSSYWRAFALGEYTHTEWLRGSADNNPRTTGGVIINPYIPGEVANPAGASLSQSFFIERPLGNEVLSAYPLQELYFPSETLTLASDGTVRSPSPLGNGTNYSAVSAVRDTSPQTLRDAPPVSINDTRGDAALVLPYDMPAEIQALSDQIAAHEPTEYDTVEAVVHYLSTTERYSLDTPRLDDGADAVDQFLFKDHVGFCEQFSSALAVLLRMQHIPARVAVGYATGDRDAFTGTYTVHNSDAHAWAEVYFPTVGWVPFDSAPGFNPQTDATSGGDGFLSNVTLNAGSLSAPLGTTITAAGLIFGAPAAVVVLFLWWERRRGLLPEVRRYRAAQAWLRRARLPARLPQQTVAEHLLTLRRRSPEAALRIAPLAGAVEQALYGAPHALGRASVIAVARISLSHRLGLSTGRSKSASASGGDAQEEMRRR